MIETISSIADSRFPPISSSLHVSTNTTVSPLLCPLLHKAIETSTPFDYSKVQLLDMTRSEFWTTDTPSTRYAQAKQ